MSYNYKTSVLMAQLMKCVKQFYPKIRYEFVTNLMWPIRGDSVLFTMFVGTNHKK